MNRFKKLSLLIMVLSLGYSSQAFSTFYIGAQGHPAFILNDSAKNSFDETGWGGSVHVFYSPEFFLGDFIALGLRQSITFFEGTGTTNAKDSNSFDTLFAARVAWLDTPFEDWTWDFVLEAGVNYFQAKAEGGDDNINFTYALGVGLRYFLFAESALGTFARWHQTVGDFTLATGTSMTNLNLIELGLFYEISF
ncbi:MAG TPA: hypothetical protein VJB34_02520 [Bdellovibrionota bacterium]|nr:hypothetical protein [Bdellovibrionota bacterium]